jgi:hypothetical protein
MAVSQGWSHATGKGFDQIGENLRDLPKLPVWRSAKMPLNHEQGQVMRLIDTNEGI